MQTGITSVSIQEQCKHVASLRTQDFQRHHVWAWLNDDPDSSMVCPVLLTDHIIDEDTFGEVFLSCILTTVDGDSFHGNIALNVPRKQPYYIAFAYNDDEFIFSGSMIPGIGSLQDLAHWLGKPITTLSPIIYRTSYRYRDGSAVNGSLDLTTW